MSVLARWTPKNPKNPHGVISYHCAVRVCVCKKRISAAVRVIKGECRSVYLDFHMRIGGGVFFPCTRAIETCGEVKEKGSGRHAWGF